METEKASSFNLRSEALLNLKLYNVTIKGLTLYILWTKMWGDLMGYICTITGKNHWDKNTYSILCEAFTGNRESNNMQEGKIKQN